MSTAAIFVGFIVSTIGLALAVYGKKQARPPQLVVGMLLIACPVAVPGAFWDAVVSSGLIAALVLAVRMGW